MMSVQLARANLSGRCRGRRAEDGKENDRGSEDPPVLSHRAPKVVLAAVGVRAYNGPYT